MNCCASQLRPHPINTVVIICNIRTPIERLNNRELLEVIMHRINSLDPGYHFGGSYRFFGTLYTRLPGVDIAQSKKYFDQGGRPGRLWGKITFS